MTHTAESIIAASPKFVEIATNGALELVAKTNGQTVGMAKKAFAIGADNVTKEVYKLVYAAAEEFANQLNNEAAA